MGLARTFQNIRLFKDLTVLDNVRIAMHKDVRYGLLSSFLHLPSFVREEKRLKEKSLELLRVMGLEDKKDELAKNLPYGEQRHLEIARALATNPVLLLLDEPAAGMNPQETDELTAFIGEIRDKFNLTIFLIEHHMDLVMHISDRIYVLDFGKLIAEGTPEEIQNNQRVIDAYLGVAEDA
jgi:branched-chain amino acid transport system ATP-binding protein